jgi:hypothetical protein
MAGNEAIVVDYLLKSQNSISINHLGVINRIQNPGANGQLIDITSTKLLRTEDSGKKADIYLNGKGISIKQSGASNLYNRFQRAEMIELFTLLKFKDPNKTLSKIDGLINKFHNGELSTRNRPWIEGFDPAEFKVLLEFLMMKGSPNHGISNHPAEYILTAPKTNITANKICCDTFEEYYTKNKDSIYVSLRRQWIGQASKTEHARALGLTNKPNNMPWVFKTISGKPRGWRSEKEIPINDRRTVYMIFITLNKTSLRP